MVIRMALQIWPAMVAIYEVEESTNFQTIPVHRGIKENEITANASIQFIFTSLIRLMNK